MATRLTKLSAGVAGVVAAGGLAVAAAQTISTDPSPSFVTHVTTPSTPTSDVATTSDDATSTSTPTITAGSSPASFDDHGGDRDRGGDDDTAVLVVRFGVDVDAADVMGESWPADMRASLTPR
jgi:hypothetical protein